MLNIVVQEGCVGVPVYMQPVQTEFEHLKEDRAATADAGEDERGDGSTLWAGCRARLSINPNFLERIHTSLFSPLLCRSDPGAMPTEPPDRAA
jgi:hypothetical protein